ncbi:MAG: Tyrosine--tRNA ligase [Parcubacteria group bacterium]|nr:Tyrosine--tRNA ligase [Parcubacteria group bacterium]
MNLAEDLKARGLVEHSSAPIETILEKKRTVYLGVDPTADSMHVGHLVPLTTMKRLAADGHKIVLLVGGGTGMIGDPKEKGERVLLDSKAIAKNKKALKEQMQRIVGAKITVVDNADWLLKVHLVDFLRDIGKHFTVNELIKRDIIRRRLETPDESISYTEFAYSLLQGYDFLELYQKKGVDLQIGSSDQWTNILSGVELIRRKLGKEAFALCGPIVTDASGKKFGKSEGNAVWLDAKKTSPFKFYQFWLTLPDEGLENYFRYYTFLSIAEIDTLIAAHKENPGAREAQETLARLITETVHGPAAAATAAAASSALFGGSLKELPQLAHATILAEAPNIPVLKADVTKGLSVLDVLATSPLVSSKSDAKRLIEGNGISLNGKTVTNEQMLSIEDFVSGLALVKRGKREVLILVLK